MVVAANEKGKKMRRILSILAVIAVLACSFVPYIVSGATSDLLNTYYSAGAYDGGLWYSTNAEADPAYTEQQTSESNTGYSCNDTTYEAQTFTPTVTQLTQTIDLYANADAADVGKMDIHIYATSSGKPTGGVLASADLHSNYMHDEFAYSWVTCNFTTQITLTAGTMYALVMHANWVGDNFSWSAVLGDGSAYSRGTRAYSTDSGATWTIYSTDDFVFRFYSIQTAYSIAHDGTAGNIAANTFVTMGQSYDSSIGEYEIGRGALFFDTSNLLTDDNIMAASLKLWVQGDYSTTDFDLCIVDGSGLNGPLETSDYYELLLRTDNCGYITTSGIATSGYTTIPLNTTGLNILNKSGYTKLGLRSYEDINNSPPTGNEYLDIYMGESAHPPILTVTYTTSTLGVPDEMKIENVYIFTGYRQTKDMLFVWQNTLRYESIPRIAPTEYFVVQLLDSDNDTIGQTVVNDWGYTPLSIYLDNVTVASVLPWKSTCTLLLTGSSLFGTPSGFTPYRYEVQDADWRGLTTSLPAWCKSTAYWMEDMNGEDRNTYITISDTGDWCFDPEEIAQFQFLEGIPFLDSAFPELFMVSGGIHGHGEDVDHTFSTTLYSSIWGTYWTSAFQNLADGIGIGVAGQYVIGFILGAIVAVCGAVVRQKTGDPNISLLVMVVGFVICVALGTIAMDVVLMVTIFALYFLLHNILLSRT
jgi:hypothetical protein